VRRALIYLVVALVVGGAVGTLMARDPGYVLVTYRDMSFETSLWFALFALIGGYLILRVVVWIGVRIMRSGAGVAAWQQNRRSRIAVERTTRGLVLIGEGDWNGARKALLADAENVDSSLINYLGAARAANEIGDSEQRDALLQQAAESTAGSTLAVALIRAELQMAAGQVREAVETLLAAKSGSPNHPRVLRLLAECYERSGDWGELLALAPELHRRGGMPADQWHASLRRWAIGFFQHPPAGAAAEVAQQLIDQWNALDKDVRSDPELIAACVSALLDVDANAAAESTLSKALKQDWHDNLVALYGRVRLEPADRQIATAEGWLKARPNDPTLLLALGRIALSMRDWTKAREYLEASLKQRRSAEVYGELGRLCLAVGERARATELLAQAVELDGRLPKLPLPDAAQLDASAAHS
jgi:HemY protein